MVPYTIRISLVKRSIKLAVTVIDRVDTSNDSWRCPGMYHIPHHTTSEDMYVAQADPVSTGRVTIGTNDLGIQKGT